MGLRIVATSVRLRWGLFTTCILTAVIFWSGIEPSALAAQYIDYLYVEANDGDSSGGHVAIRFENETFHFQHESPGILRIRRHEAAEFLHSYAMLGNRAIQESRIAVSSETYALLRDAFAHLLLIQNAQLDIRDSLRQDVALFELLLRQRSSPQSSTNEILLSLNGLGYFLPDSPPLQEMIPDSAVAKTALPSSPALVSLRRRIYTIYGTHFIAERIAQTRTNLRGLELRAANPSVLTISRDVLPDAEAPASKRYQDILYSLLALELLQSAPPLRAGTFCTTDADTFKLEPFEVLALSNFAEQLETDLVRLINSPRTDWGFPFILGMARLSAIKASIASGRLVLLDVFPRDSRDTPQHSAALQPYLPMIESERRGVYLRKRSEFFMNKVFREADYAAMERSGNRLFDIRQVMTTGSALRVSSESPFPSREASLNVPLPAQPDESTLLRQLTAARTLEHDYQAVLDRLYSYDLFNRNCVTEIFAVINDTIARDSLDQAHMGDSTTAEPVAVTSRESQKRLGGFVDATQGFAFIPFVSASTVESSYAVVASRNIPSYRAQRLADMNRREPALSVFLRESNTITSTVYRPGSGDSTFLFFTDEAPTLRPLFGMFNLLVGFGECLTGIVTLPVNGPERLLSGTKAVLFSLPELVFVNIRKGSIAYAEQSTDSSASDIIPAFPPGQSTAH
jgi:hypothetical protein